MCLDQLTKQLVLHGIRIGEARVLIPGFVNLTHSRNTGFAFGLLEKAPDPLQHLFFLGVPIFALILIVLIFIKLRDDQMLTSIALATILGGATGNLIDRLNYRYVIDFLDFKILGLPLPMFNVADLSIVLGVAIMFVSTLVYRRGKSQSPA